ncbi:MAG: M23 family metallopeptidase [Dehalococcoidia bacterium]
MQILGVGTRRMVLIPAILLLLIVARATAARAYGPFTLPFTGGAALWTITCDFLCHQGYGQGGIDYGMPEGTQVLAAADGTIVITSAGFSDEDHTCVDVDPCLGNFVILEHGNGYLTIYGHLQYGSIQAAIGSAVTRGQVIANSGNTGSTTGPHLHFEVQHNGVRVDPYAGSLVPAYPKYLWTTAQPSSP